MITNTARIWPRMLLSAYSTVPPLRRSAVPPFRRSAAPPLRRSAVLPLSRSAIPPLHRSAVPPFRHSRRIRVWATFGCRSYFLVDSATISLKVFVVLPNLLNSPTHLSILAGDGVGWGGVGCLLACLPACSWRPMGALSCFLCCWGLTLNP